MREITTKAEQEKKRRRNQFIVGFILVAVMLFSTVGYAFRSNEDTTTTGNEKTITYNGFAFTNQNNLWFLTLGNSQFSFSNNPKEVQQINSNLNTSLSTYSGKPLYISSEDKVAEVEIYRNLDQLVLRRQYACLNNSKCDENFPIKTCNDNFIIIQNNSLRSITQENNCIFIRGPQENLTELTDSFLFKTIGIN
jgi:hypothetical protein